VITPEFVRMCSLCPLSFLFSFSVYPVRSALWLPWRHNKTAAAPLLYLEHAPRSVAILLLLFVALSCIMFANGDQ
jgi:hypothetical protein